MAYQHASKAGNFADVHKHWLLSLLLTSLGRRYPNLHYIESHAGCGGYRLRSSSAHHDGIARLWGNDLPLSAGAESYMGLLRRYNPSAYLQYYPGSPLLARELMPPTGHLTLYEHQPDCYRQLKLLLQQDERVELHNGDGLEGILASLQPSHSPTLLLIDPPYVAADEGERLARTLNALGSSRPSLTLLLWYPLRCGGGPGMPHGIDDNTAASLTRGYRHEYLHAEANGKMCGSGMLLLNPPQVVLGDIEAEGQVLAGLLGGRARLTAVPHRAPATAPAP